MSKSYRGVFLLVALIFVSASLTAQAQGTLEKFGCLDLRYKEI
jgi:hypothetical protein